MKRKETNGLVVVGDGTLKINGNVESQSSIAMSGEIHGDVLVRTATAVITDMCRVFGNVTAKVVEVVGSVNGNISANRVVIRENGHVDGDISTETIMVDEGGSFNGNCKMVKGADDGD